RGFTFRLSSPRTVKSGRQVGYGPLPANRLAELLRHVFERGVGVRSNRTNGRQAHDDDQRQHHGVFDRSRTVFRDEETLYLRCETLHCILRFSGRPSPFTSQNWEGIGEGPTPYRLTGAVVSRSR